jgi:hypothetical protein
LEHTEDRYEILRHGAVIATETHRRSPATRWYTQEQVVRLYQAAGFTTITLFHGFTHEPATEHDTLFSALGLKP